MRRRLFQLAGIMLVAFLVALLVPFTQQPAQLSLASTTRSNPPVGTGYAWSVPFGSIERAGSGCANASDTFLRYGTGWDNRDFYSYGTTDTSTAAVRASVFRLGEMCHDASLTSGARFRVPSKSYTLPWSGSGTQPAKISLGAVVPTLTCASTEWSTVASRTTLSANSGRNFTEQGSPNTPSAGDNATVTWTSSATGAPAWGTAITDALCPYLFSASFTVCTFTGPNSAGPDCLTHTWTAERWYTTGLSSGTAPAPETELCTHLVHPNCDMWEPVDGTTFAGTCGNAPAFTPPAWTAFSDWWPTYTSWTWAAVGYYAKCLFAPVGGWDPGGRIPTVYGATMIGEIQALAHDAGAAFSITESCGPIVDASAVPALDGFAVNSCSWSSWGGPVKTFVGWTAAVAFAFWAVGFLVQLVLSLVRAAPMPTMLATEAALGPQEPGSM